MTEQVAFLMADASRLFRRAFDARARELGITGQQWRVLVTLARQPGMNQGAAAELLEVEPITLSRMVDRLQEAGLVERRSDPCDRRAWRLHLLDAAIPLVEQMRAVANNILEEALDGFNPEQRILFTGFVEQFRENLTQRQSDDDRPVEPQHVRA